MNKNTKEPNTTVPTQDHRGFGVAALSLVFSLLTNGYPVLMAFERVDGKALKNRPYLAWRNLPEGRK